MLFRSAVNEGEMTQEQAGLEKSKVRIDGPVSDRSGPGWEEVPETLRDLVDRSRRLQERIRRLDQAIYDETHGVAHTPAANPVADQLGLLSRAFGDEG